MKKKSGVPAGSSRAPFVKKNGGSAEAAGEADEGALAPELMESRYERETAGTTPKERIAATLYFIMNTI